MRVLTVLHALVFVLGAYLVIVTVTSAIKTFVLPRAAQVFISRVRQPDQHAPPSGRRPIRVRSLRAAAGVVR